METINRFIKSNGIVSHLGTFYLSSGIGYNLGWYLTKGSKMAKTIKGAETAVGLSIATNLGLLYYRNIYLNDTESDIDIEEKLLDANKLNKNDSENSEKTVSEKTVSEKTVSEKAVSERTKRTENFEDSIESIIDMVSGY
tara:strand:+ start:4651 stop:5070 length:420 start_codon:yes stop_codon:yes gene_type:complete